jgi:hypothetical protein
MRTRQSSPEWETFWKSTLGPLSQGRPDRPGSGLIGSVPRPKGGNPPLDERPHCPGYSCTVSDWSDEETRDPLYADDRNFYKVEKWTRDGMASIACSMLATVSPGRGHLRPRHQASPALPMTIRGDILAGGLRTNLAHSIL